MRLRTVLTLARLVDGVLLLAFPGRALRRTVHGVDDTPARVVTRVLGARHLVQAALTGPRPGPTALWVGAGVDALHATTAVGFAAVDPHRRHAALANGLSAALFAVAGVVLARRHGRR